MHLTSARSIWIIRIVWTIIALGIVIALGRALPLNASGPVPIMLDEVPYRDAGENRTVDETGPRSGAWRDRPNSEGASSFAAIPLTAISFTAISFTTISPTNTFNTV